MCQLIGQTIVKIRSTESSNNYAISQVRDNELEEGTVFLAYEQTAGKGQMNNGWESQPGKNLTFSILLKPEFLEIRHQFMLSKVVCLGLESFLSKYLSGVKIKWPNDIYIEDEKLCGILIENSLMNGVIIQSVAGIGLNVNQKKFISDAPNPTSLQILTNKEYKLDELLEELLRLIDFFYRKLKKGEYGEIDNCFVEKLYQLNELKWYEDDKHSYQGEIIGVNEIGQLLIQEKNGPLHEYHFKEVAYLKENPKF